ncbi:anthocyanidin 3-O-glucosyltransferase 2-like [Senna tora]|uniref:Glycosyltransferase n=1 Tax=Senna tora TaxID=362788 RepID=A0A834WR36_9FABA|nr:anthocyanidin 3-O-glucosyltransferase 2-like [Senna tora]
MPKLQLVFLPAPGKGHLVSTIEFAKLLINHDHRLHIALLIIPSPIDADLHSYIHSLSSSPSFPKRLQLTILPSNYPTKPLTLCDFLETLVENQKPHVRRAVSSLASAPGSPRLAGFIVDMFCTSMIDVADEFGVPSMVFYTSGAAYLGFALHFHALRERNDVVDTTAFNFKDSGVEFSIPSYVNPVPAKVLPLVVLEKEWESYFARIYAGGMKRAKGIIVNTFEELEPHAVHSFSSGEIPVYPVGPILSLKDDPTENPVEKESDVIKWLDDQPPLSVIFLCFGSRGYFDQDNQVGEIARALESSGVRFLWSLRKPPPKGSMEAPSDYSDLEEVLSKGFLERTAEIGRVIGWAPQAQILAHRAIGGFVSHCGWNSILESVYFGVPIATWPFGAEQQMNAFQLVRELGMAVEISLDYRVKFENGSKTEILSAGRIEKGIKEVMAKESEIRKKVKDMSEKSRKALLQDGSSYAYLGAERMEKGIRDVMKEDKEMRKMVKEMSEICKKALMEGGSSYYHVGRLIDDPIEMKFK